MSLHSRLPLTGREKLKGSLVLPLHSTMVPLPGTMGGCLSTVCWNAAITWPQAVLREEDSLAVAAQVHGNVGLSSA